MNAFVWLHRHFKQIEALIHNFTTCFELLIVAMAAWVIISRATMTKRVIQKFRRTGR